VTPESKVKMKVRKVIKELNAYYVMPVTAGFGNSGAPDYIVCYRGKFFGIECKANGNTPTALQYKNLKEIQDCGGVALVVNEDNVNQLYEVLRSHDP
jgi:hypothetical protein